MTIGKFLLIGVVCALLYSACSSDFLNIKVQGQENTLVDPNLATKLVTGVYNTLLQGDSWGNGDVHGFAYISATDIMSDDADKGSFAADQAPTAGDIDNFTLTSGNTFALSLWLGHYNSIGAANQALAQLDLSKLDTATKSQLKGELCFLRGYLYFNLVRMFGDVPLPLRVPVNSADAQSDSSFNYRSPKSKVYKSIVKDLQFAITHLPKVAVSIDGRTGHASKGAAQAMLAKVYMYMEDWPNTLAMSNAVITSGLYSLLPDYAMLFRQAGANSVESIFEIQTGLFNNANLGVPNYTVSQGPRVGGLGGWDDLGWGFCDPTSSLVSAYESGDLRKAATIIFIDNSGTHHGTSLWDGVRIPSSDSIQNLRYNYKAYTSLSEETHSPGSDKDRPKNIPILRFAEVLLINSEAAFHAGGDALTPLNKVRLRAGLKPRVSVTIDSIWNERRVELAMEHDRFWDIVRQGRAAQIMQAHGKSFVAGKHELLPIPVTQIQLSGGKLTQNNGY